MTHFSRSAAVSAVSGSAVRLTSEGYERPTPRVHERCALPSLLVGEQWDYEEFRKYVITHARNAGIANSSVALAAAVGTSQSNVSRWFRGVEKPSVANLQKIADRVPGTEFTHLMVLAGRASVEDMNLPLRPAQPRELHPLAYELDGLLAETSSLTSAERQQLAEMVERIMTSFRVTARAGRR